MLVSEGVLKWAISFYPPLFFQRIRVVRFDKGFRGVEVKIIKSIFNKNFNGSIFGGTIFAAADPFYPLLFHQILINKGYKLRTWSQSLSIHFLKPATTNLHFKISIGDADLADCEQALNAIGKYRKTFPIEIYDKNEILCASVSCMVYLRNLNYAEAEDQKLII